MNFNGGDPEYGCRPIPCITNPARPLNASPCREMMRYQYCGVQLPIQHSTKHSNLADIITITCTFPDNVTHDTAIISTACSNVPLLSCRPSVTLFSPRPRMKFVCRISRLAFLPRCGHLIEKSNPNVNPTSSIDDIHFSLGVISYDRARGHRALVYKRKISDRRPILIRTLS